MLRLRGDALKAGTVAIRVRVILRRVCKERDVVQGVVIRISNWGVVYDVDINRPGGTRAMRIADGVSENCLILSSRNRDGKCNHLWSIGTA